MAMQVYAQAVGMYKVLLVVRWQATVMHVRHMVCCTERSQHDGAGSRETFFHSLWS